MKITFFYVIIKLQHHHHYDCQFLVGKLQQREGNPFSQKDPLNLLRSGKVRNALDPIYSGEVL